MGNTRNFSISGLMLGCVLLFGCDSDPSTDSLATTNATISSSELTLPMPDRIRSINALDPNSISATATVNGVPTNLQRNGNGAYTGAIQVPARSTFTVIIEFSEQFSDQRLLLASRTQQVTTGSENTQLNLRRAGYDFGSHDADGDSVSNIVEREEDTNPLDSAQTPPMVNVTVIARQPEILRSGNFSSYLFEGSVGSDTKVLTASGNDFRGDFYVVDRAPVNTTVQMIETVTGEQLAVATQSRQLNVITDQETIVFDASLYSTTDKDRDGQSDLAELLAGTDVSTPNNPPAVSNTLTTQFSLPSIIQNGQSIYAEYRVDGQLISLNRSENNFTATSNTNLGSVVVLDVRLLDNFNNIPYVLGSAQKTVSINSATQSVSFVEGDFVFSQDDDNDGTLNYLERQAGSDPFNAPVVVPPTPVSCTVSPLPPTSGLPGDWVTIENISGYVDCGSADYALNGSLFNFTWSPIANNIGWIIPVDSASGSSFDYQIQVANPTVATDVYATAVVSTQVEEVAECTETTEQVQIEAIADLFIQNGLIFNNDELRVNASNRRALIGFDVPSQEGQLTAAALVVTVGDDSGSGIIGVYQDDSFQWSESDELLSFPALTNLVGSRDGAWQTDTTYPIGLDALFVSGPRVNLFLQQDSGGNDVAFTSRETASPSVLVLEYTGCF